MEALHLVELGAWLRYRDLPGGAPARVWVHCLGGAGALYLRAAGEAALAGRRALVVDLPGFGGSDRPEGFGYAPDDHAGAVAALLDALGLRGCEVIGHSLGGHVATALAVARPELVGRLVLIEAPLAFGPGSASRSIAAQDEAAFVEGGYRALLAELREEARGDAALAAFVEAFAVADPRALHRTAHGLLRDGEALRDRFLALALPRAYLWGERTLGDPAQARWREKFTTVGIATGVVPGAGHHPNLDNPTGLAAALARVLG